MSKDDCMLVGNEYSKSVEKHMAARFLRMLKEQQELGKLGQPIDLYEHGLQTATRTLRAGEEEEIIVMSLLHDLTESLAPKNHGGAMAAILEPFLSPKVSWILRHHEVFQGFYYFHHCGGDIDARDKHKDHEHYGACARWCELYDQKSFDPEYQSEPLETFEPMVHRVLSKPAYWWDPTNPLRSVVTGS